MHSFIDAVSSHSYFDIMLMSITNLFPIRQVRQLYFSTAINVAHIGKGHVGCRVDEYNWPQAFWCTWIATWNPNTHWDVVLLTYENGDYLDSRHPHSLYDVCWIL